MNQEKQNIIFLNLSLLFILALSIRCYNPFAPGEGDLAGDLWEKQATIGQMLRNFQAAYTLRDSLRYADLIADEFSFHYWNTIDPDNEHFDQWYRETELRATGGLMRAYDRLELRWGDYQEVDDFSFPDSTAEFYVTYSLNANNLPTLFGFAYFKTRMGEDGKFRIVMWRDDF